MSPRKNRRKAGDPRLRQDGTPIRNYKKRHSAGTEHVTYVQMRYYNPETKEMQHVKGMSIIFEKYTPEQVYDLIVRAGKDAHERARLEKLSEDRKAAERLEKEGGHAAAGPSAAAAADE